MSSLRLLGLAAAVFAVTLPIPTFAERNDTRLVVVSGRQRVVGGEHLCFDLASGAYRNSRYDDRGWRNDETGRYGNGNYDYDGTIPVRVVMHFDGNIPRGRVILDGMRSPRFTASDQVFTFRVDDRRSHRLDLDLARPAMLSWLSVETPRRPIDQVSCTLASFPGNDSGYYEPYDSSRFEPRDTDRDVRFESDAGLVRRPAVLPAGTSIDLILDDRISTRTASAGDRVDAHVARDVDLDGRRVLAAGTRVEGRVVQSRDAGRFGRSSLQLSFDRIRHSDGTVDDIDATVKEVGPGSGGKQAGIIAGSAVGGAVIGKVIGGSDRDALLGAILGGGIAAGSIAAKPGESIYLPAGSVVSITLDSNTSVRW